MIAEKGKLVYSKQFNCWYFLGLNEISYPLGCGQVLSIKVFNRYRDCRLELDDDWYVIFDNACFVLMQPYIYDVKCT